MNDVLQAVWMGSSVLFYFVGRRHRPVRQPEASPEPFVPECPHAWGKWRRVDPGSKKDFTQERVCEFCDAIELRNQGQSCDGKTHAWGKWADGKINIYDPNYTQRLLYSQSIQSRVCKMCGFKENRKLTQGK